MGIRFYKPVTPGRRGASVSDFAEITDRKKRPEKSLTVRAKKTGGRNNQGKITARHRGGGHKRLYRIIDFKRNKDGVEGTVTHIEYDPNRSCRIALVQYEDGEKRYILAPEGVAAGAKVMSGESVEPNVGNCMPLSSMPVGTIIHNVEMKPGKGGQIARSAGAYAQLVGRDRSMALLRLKSGETRMVASDCRATVGAVSNQDHMNTNDGKAGRSRWRGRRPVVRGVAMNPIDHPHGGGEGRTSGGRHPVTPWGKPTKGKRTRTNKSSDKFIVRSRHQRKKR